MVRLYKSVSKTNQVDNEQGATSTKPVVSSTDYHHGQSSPQSAIKESHETHSIENGAGSDAFDHDAEKKLRAAHLDPHTIENAQDISPDEYRKTLRRIDSFMMPFMCLAVLLQFVDKTSLNYAHLLGVQNDLHFDAHQYSWLGSIFYIGYLFASPFHGLALQKLRLTRYLGANLFLWGLTLTLHAATYNYAGLVACRLFLGIFEAALTPGFILLTGRFYTSKEQISRTIAWFSMNGFAQILGGGIGYGVLSQQPEHLKVWQELFLILGAITLVYSFAVTFCLPEDPRTTRYLTARQRIVAIERVRENKTGLHDRTFKWYQVKEALLDVRLYLVFALIFTTDVANGVSTNFSTAIITSFGFNAKRTALLGMANGGSEVVSLALAVVLAHFSGTRWVPATFCLLVAITGGALVVGTHSNVIQLAGFVLMQFFAVAAALLYSLISSAIGGSTKRTVFNTVLQIGYCAGNIVGPQLAGEAPNYSLGKELMLIMFCLSIVSVCCLSLVHHIWNKQRERADLQHDATLSELADYTDRELRSFRYPL